MAPSLRGLAAKQTGGVSFVLTTLPPSPLMRIHLPQRGRQGVVPTLWEIATVTSFPRNDRLLLVAPTKRPYDSVGEGHDPPALLGPLPEGAGCEADWGSVVYYEGHSLRHGFRRATSLREGGKGMFHPVGDGPWSPPQKKRTPTEFSVGVLSIKASAAIWRTGNTPAGTRHPRWM